MYLRRALPTRSERRYERCRSPVACVHMMCRRAILDLRHAARAHVVSSMTKPPPPFKVVRSNGFHETLALAANLLIARAAYERAAKLYASDLIELRQAARVIERSNPRAGRREPARVPFRARISGQTPAPTFKFRGLKGDAGLTEDPSELQDPIDALGPIPPPSAPNGSHAAPVGPITRLSRYTGAHEPTRRPAISGAKNNMG
jgi:hypothetical protein